METGRFKTISISIKALILGAVCCWWKVLAQTPPLLVISLPSTHEGELLLESNPKHGISACSSLPKRTKYCGVASIVMVLNALSIPAPVTLEYSPLPYPG